jgi:glucosamine--fructose-6-phosphate aminotransferase (isomerizing)
MKGTFTRQEIFSQPDAWADALQILAGQRTAVQTLLRNNHYDSVIFIGCGSPYYLSLAAAALFQEQTGIYARALPASEIWLYPRSAFRGDGKTLLITVSRSGETSETLHAVEQFKALGGGSILTISCYPDKPLASMGDVNIVLPSGQEQSVAQTRAFSVLYVATVILIAFWSDQQPLIDELAKLPQAGLQLLQNYADLAVDWGQRTELDRFYFLGSGPRYGLACELNLKMKEMSLTHSEPFHFMEFRHGPMSMVTPETLIVGLRSQQNRTQENQVLEDMRAMGAQVLSLDEAAADVNFSSGLSETARNILYLPFCQIMAFERSLAKELDPDRPHNLEAVVRLDGNLS